AELKDAERALRERAVAVALADGDDMMAASEADIARVRQCQEQLQLLEIALHEAREAEKQAGVSKISGEWRRRRKVLKGHARTIKKMHENFTARAMRLIDDFQQMAIAADAAVALLTASLTTTGKPFHQSLSPAVLRNHCLVALHRLCLHRNYTLA